MYSAFCISFPAAVSAQRKYGVQGILAPVDILHLFFFAFSRAVLQKRAGRYIFFCVF